MHIYTYFTHTHTHTHKHTHTHTHMYNHIYTYIHVYIYTYVNSYIHTHIPSWRAVRASASCLPRGSIKPAIPKKKKIPKKLVHLCGKVAVY